ncbi:MAG: ABC transporter permease, partial [Actinobacteria bacterium]|nr:ABC transporter permease [Actinomycetota bacterium]
NLGFSYSQGQNVSTLIRVRLPATIELGLTGLVLAIGLALISAGWAVYSRRRGADVTLRTASSVAMGTPTFWLALVLILLLSLKVGVFPGPEGRLSSNINPPPNITGLYTVDALLSGQISTFFNAVWHLLLPGFVIAVAPFAFLSRLFRAQLRTTLREPFITVQRSQGLTRRQAFLRHAVPNSMLALIPASALLFAELLTGSVLVEKIFAWPGVGAMTVDAIEQKDFAVVQGVILLSTLFYVLISMLADVVHTTIDPRLRVGR